MRRVLFGGIVLDRHGARRDVCAGQWDSGKMGGKKRYGRGGQNRCSCSCGGSRRTKSLASAHRLPSPGCSLVTGVA